MKRINLKKASLVGVLLATTGAVSLVFREAIFGNTFEAISIQLLAAGLMLWARLTFGSRSFHASAEPTEGGLIDSGPYRFVRHPIYASLLYFVWAGFSSHFSLINLILTLLVSIGLVIRMLAEETLIAVKYPEYKIYADKTKRIIPFII